MDIDNPELYQALSQSPGYLFSAASRMLRERTANALEPLSLSLNEYVVLRLVGMRVNLSQGSLGDIHGIDPATMVDLIDRLEKSELVFRERNPDDRRKYLLHLTPKGNKVLSRAARMVRKMQKEFLSPLSEEEWAQTRASLWKLVEANLTAKSAKP